MAMRMATLLFLAGLPLAAAADDGSDLAACSALAERFGSSPRQLSISELDSLKSCINTQVTAMGASGTRQTVGTDNVRRLARTSLLRDDL